MSDFQNLLQKPLIQEEVIGNVVSTLNWIRPVIWFVRGQVTGVCSIRWISTVLYGAGVNTFTVMLYNINQGAHELAQKFTKLCSFSWNLDLFHVNSKKLGVQAPQKVFKVWIGNYNVKARKTTDHKLHKIHYANIQDHHAEFYMVKKVQF